MRASTIAVVASVLSIGIAGYAVLEVQALRADLSTTSSMRIEGPGGATEAEVSERLVRLEAEVARLDEAAGEGPALQGRSTAPMPIPSSIAPDLQDEAVAEQLESIVDTAVEKAVDEKARKFRLKQNKKPPLDLFASVLELDEKQREIVADEIVRAQQEIRDLLEVPTDDGTVFLDQVVELMAQGIAGKDAGWGAFVQRVVTEKVPGTDDTYGARIEASKQRLREAFQREMTEAQYAEFTSWQMDPTEVEDVPGSPYAELEPRVLERARELGVQLPDDD